MRLNRKDLERIEKLEQLRDDLSILWTLRWWLVHIAAYTALVALILEMVKELP